MPPSREPLATRKNAMLTLSAFLVICTAWWYSQQPSTSPPPPPPPPDTVIVVDPPDTTTPPVPCTLSGGSGTVGSANCIPCSYIPPGPGTASVSAACVPPATNTCNLIGGSGNIGDPTCQPCGFNPPGAGYATGATECVAPPPPEPCTLQYGTGTPGSSTCQPCPYNPPGQGFATQAPTCVPPTPPDTVVEPTGKIGNATIAELPRSTYDPQYPVGLTKVTVASGGNLQAAINAATGNTEIALAPGGTFTGNYTLPNKGANSGWILIRTDVSLLASRMTPSKATSSNLAHVCTNNTTPVFVTAPGANHYWITGLDICGLSGNTGGNQLIRIGLSAGEGQTSRASAPTDVVLDRNYIHVVATNNLRRCVQINALRIKIIKNWIDECHDPGGDSQAIGAYNGGREVLIEDNTLIGAHEIILFGGADAADSTLQPADIIIRGNHIYRPASWKCGTCPGGYSAGQWPVKNLIETKNVRRLLIEGNVLENSWSDAQQFAFIFKSENQDGSNPWATSADITFRYNRIRNIGAGINMAGIAGSNPVITAARFYIHDNWLESGWQTGPYVSDGNISQVLQGLKDLIFAHNTFRNPSNTNAVISFDGAPSQNMVFHSNVVYHGDYGAKGGGQGVGNTSINTYMLGGLFKNNVLIGGDCSLYPLTTVCPGSWPTSGVAGFDGRAAGADTVAIKTRTANVVVAP